MSGKQISILVISIILSFLTGVGAHIGFVVLIEENQSEEMNIRVNNGYVEWWDGENWNRNESVEVLKEQDPYYIAEQELIAFEESYRAELETQNDAIIGEALEERKVPLVGVEKVVASSTATTSSTTSGNVTEETVATPEVVSPTPGYVAPPTTTVTPTVPVTPTPPVETPQPSTPAEPSVPVVPETPVTPPATGDGEDIGWSDDYL